MRLSSLVGLVVLLMLSRVSFATEMSFDDAEAACHGALQAETDYWVQNGFRVDDGKCFIPDGVSCFSYTYKLCNSDDPDDSRCSLSGNGTGFCVAPCASGDMHSGGYPGQIADGAQKCIKGCKYTFHPSAPDASNGGDAGGGSRDICVAMGTCVRTGNWTGSGARCTTDPATQICDENSGKCVDLDHGKDKACDENSGICVQMDDNSHPPPPPTICAGDNCIPVPPKGGQGACGTTNNSALCAGPGAPSPGPAAPPPPVAPPPIDPYSNQPPPVLITTSPSSDGSGSQQNNAQNSKCGVSGAPPCKTNNNGSGGDDGKGNSCGGANQPACKPPAGGATCNDGTVSADGYCPANCPHGGRPVYTAFGPQCPGGGSPSCPDGAQFNSDFNCPPPHCGAGFVLAANNTCQPVTCGKGETLGQDNQCHSVPQCQSPAKMGTDGQCYLPSQCPAGSTKQSDGTCKNDGGGSNPPPQCPNGYYFNGSSCTAQPASGGGNPGGGGTGGQPQTGCTAGAVCNDSASGGYDCNSAPSCSGDPVLCNIDFQDWRANCPGDHLPGQDDMEAALASLPTDKSAVVKDDADVDLTTSLDSSGFMAGSGTCPVFDPLAFAFGGQSVSVDFNSSASWCLLMQAIGALLMVLAYFKAFQIMMRG